MIDVSALSILPGYHTPSPQTRCGQWGEMTTLYILHFILFLGANLFFGKDIVYILVIACRAKHRLASLYMRWHFKQEMLIICIFVA